MNIWTYEKEIREWVTWLEYSCSGQHSLAVTAMRLWLFITHFLVVWCQSKGLLSFFLCSAALTHSYAGSSSDHPIGAGSGLKYNKLSFWKSTSVLQNSFFSMWPWQAFIHSGKNGRVWDAEEEHTCMAAQATLCGLCEWLYSSGRGCIRLWGWSLNGGKGGRNANHAVSVLVFYLGSSEIWTHWQS